MQVHSKKFLIQDTVYTLDSIKEERDYFVFSGGAAIWPLDDELEQLLRLKSVERFEKNVDLNSKIHRKFWLWLRRALGY